MNISVFGLGYVGSVCVGCLSDMGHSLIGVDISPEKISSVNNGQPPIVEKDLNELFLTNFRKGLISATSDINNAVLISDITLVCVGTPNDESGHLDTTIVEKVISDIGLALRDKETFHVIVIRSTVPPNTIDSLEVILESKSGKKTDKDFSIVMNPEFLREGSAVADFFNPPYILVGTNNNKSFNLIKMMYSGIDSKVIRVVPKIAEMIKFVNNSFHALKITFANEIGNICYDLNINSNELMEVFVQDRQLNISSKYFKPGFAYGGSCLPKDLEGVLQIAKDLRVNTPVLNSIRESNNLQIKRLIKFITGLNIKSLGFLGFAFKKGTDDVRNSPILDVIHYFLMNDYKICVYDQNINISKLTGMNKKYLKASIGLNMNIFSENAIKVCNESDLIIISNSDQEYFIDDKYLLNKTIIDLTRAFSHLSKKTNYYNYK